MITREQALKMVNPGWSALIHEAYDKLPADTAVTDVKEKFGTLRIYISSAPPPFYDTLDHIEEKSALVCEYCGNSAETRDIGGWYKTICDACLEKRHCRES